ncbi:MAG: sulfatase-like hydrolase/transferase [Rubrivivax sp.]|nr:sulfatase-like hydrolase/transferase [Rubrivivax sp.]MBK8528267.1 sulfatase-like hydrolase/transferase [Rubrivivax sp.]
MNPPNILLLTSDQHRGDCFGFEGRRVHTPHLDLLARQGTRFSACITPNVVCMPARASMLTGLLPLTHGTADNGIDLDPGIAEGGFAGTLGRGGYQTAFIGKAHFSSNHSVQPTGRCENVASSHRFGDDWHGPYMGFEHLELMQLGHNYWLPERPPGGMHYERWYHGDGLGDLKDALYRQQLGSPVSAAQTHASALPPAWHNSSWVGDRTVEYLRARGRERRAGLARPFCAWISFADPHHPFDAPVPWSALHRPQEVDLPVHRVRDLDRRPWWHRAALENAPGGPDRKVREAYSRISQQSDMQLRELIASYYGMISLVDHNVGRVLAALQDEGLADDTLVVFTSDHGDWLGDHGLVLKGPMFYEGLLRVGLILRGPGVPTAKVLDDPVSTIDLAATFGDYAGVPQPAASHSRSLRPLLDGVMGRYGSREHAYTEWRLGPARCGVALDLRGVRTHNAKLTVELGSGAGELYDLYDDPHECVNRFDDPAARGFREELMQRLMCRPDDIMDPLPATVGPA